MHDDESDVHVDQVRDKDENTQDQDHDPNGLDGENVDAVVGNQPASVLIVGDEHNGASDAVVRKCCLQQELHEFGVVLLVLIEQHFSPVKYSYLVSSKFYIRNILRDFVDLVVLLVGIAQVE